MNRGRKEATGDGKGGAQEGGHGRWEGRSAQFIESNLTRAILVEASEPVGYRVQGWRKSTNLKGERWRRGERLSVPGEEGLNNRAARGGVMVSTSSGGGVCVECGWQAIAV